jgi:hypothetical protein
MFSINHIFSKKQQKNTIGITMGCNIFSMACNIELIFQKEEKTEYQEEERRKEDSNLFFGCTVTGEEEPTLMS